MLTRVRYLPGLCSETIVSVKEGKPLMPGKNSDITKRHDSANIPFYYSGKNVLQNAFFGVKSALKHFFCCFFTVLLILQLKILIIRLINLIQSSGVVALPEVDAIIPDGDATTPEVDATFRLRDAIIRLSNATKSSSDVALPSSEIAKRSSDAALPSSDMTLRTRDGALLKRYVGILKRYAALLKRNATKSKRFTTLTKRFVIKPEHIATIFAGNFASTSSYFEKHFLNIKSMIHYF